MRLRIGTWMWAAALAAGAALVVVPAVDTQQPAARRPTGRRGRRTASRT